jgi:hypothetical protein
LYAIGVVVEVQLTPTRGLLVEVESAAMPTPRVVLETDENGEISALVGSSDVVTVRSAMSAVVFTPISKPAVDLRDESPLVIQAERLVEVAGICRLSTGVGQDEVVFSLQNVADGGVDVATSEWRNALVQDGAFLASQPPEFFSNGPSSFSVPVSSFLAPRGQCVESAYHLVGKSYPISCTVDRSDVDVPLCAGEGVLQCSSILSGQVRKVMRRVVRGFYEGRKMADKLRKAYPAASRGFSIIREATRATSKIEKVLSDVQKQVATCSPGKRACMQVLFPRQEILTLFNKGFRPRPPVGRSPYRALIGRAESRLRQILRTFPRTIVVCGD